MPALILFDGDGVVFDNNALLEEHMPAMLHSHLNRHGEFTYEEFEALRLDYYKNAGSTIQGFAKRWGKDAAWCIENQRITNVMVGNVIRPLLKPDTLQVHKLQRLKARGHRLGLITHAHREYTLPLLQSQGMAEVFPPEVVFDVSLLKGATKQEEATYQYVLNQLGADQYDTWFMVEDSAINLPPFKRLGGKTVYVNPEPAAEKYRYAIDRAFHAFHPALDYLLEAA